MYTKRPVVMLLIPGRDALCVELSGLWLGACLAAFALPFLSAMTARAYLGPQTGARPSLAAASASLSQTMSPAKGPARPPYRALAPAMIVGAVDLHDEHHESLGSEDALLPAIPEGAVTPAPQPSPRRALSGDVIAARTVKRAFSPRRENLGIDAERAGELALGALHMHAVHHGETVNMQPFDASGRLLADPLAQLRHLMRCRVTGREVAIDPTLVRILTQISAAYERPLQLISGYRTPNTLGTNPTSQHTLGRAADISIRGVSLPALRKLAIDLGARGVGFYPEKGFVHVDVRKKARYFWNYTSKQGEVQYQP